MTKVLLLFIRLEYRITWFKTETRHEKTSMGILQQYMNNDH